MADNVFWTNKVWGIEAESFFDLIKKLNEFYKDRFVIATQTFQEGKSWRAIVYFKEQPEGSRRGSYRDEDPDPYRGNDREDRGDVRRSGGYRGPSRSRR